MGRYYLELTLEGTRIAQSSRSGLCAILSNSNNDEANSVVTVIGTIPVGGANLLSEISSARTSGLLTLLVYSGLTQGRQSACSANVRPVDVSEALRRLNRRCE